MPQELSNTVTIDELKLGMYVLDVTSKNRFFKIKTQGLVKSQKIIDQLKKQGVVSLVVKAPQETSPEDKQDVSSTDSSQTNIRSKKTALIKTKSLEDEFHKSCQIYDDSTKCIKKLFDDIQLDKTLNFSAVNDLASEITNSVIRNEYAMSILTRIRHHSTYQWEHAINSGVLLCGFSLFLGIKKETATDITVGAILHDIGVAKVPRAIIEKKGKLTINEKDVVEKHVSWGHQLLKADDVSNKITTDMLINHHERLDGSGYPRGIAAGKLSKLARMTAIVDVYDAMTGDKHHKQGEQPINALRYLLAKNDKFDRVLVQQFIKFIGVHPVGSLVKLSNETLAIITEGNRNDPLKPKVVAFYNTKYNRSMTSKKHCLVKESISILASIRAEDYKINISRIIREVIG